MVYIRENLSCKLIPFHNKPKDIEAILFELTLRNKKWLLMGGYNPANDTTSYFLDHVSKSLDKNMANYDNILIIGDLNSTMSDGPMKNFCEIYNLENLINEPTCYKNPDNPSSIDVVLTNSKNSFQNSMAIETGLSDHHKMVVTVLKNYCKKKEPLTIKYRSYKHFDMPKYRNILTENLENFDKEIMSYGDFHEIFIRVLDRHAPIKTKRVRGNNGPFMTKALSKEIMHRTKLKNNLNKNPNEENKRLYKKQRNFCVALLKREKKKYYNNLDLRIFKDNQKFWETVKPLFSDKQKLLERNIVIIEDEKVYLGNTVVAEKLNNFFVEAVQSREIQPFISGAEINTSAGNIEEIIKQYERHPSILQIKEHVIITDKFEFDDRTPHDINKRILDLDPKKASIENDIPIKILISSNDIVAKHLAEIHNNSKYNENYPCSPKLGTITPINKKTTRTLLKKDYRPVSLIPIISKLYKKNMYDQISAYIDKFLSPYLFGYRKTTVQNKV